METNLIIDELKAMAGLDWNPDQKAFYEKRADDSRPVKCVPMREVFTPEQLQFLFKYAGYKPQQKMCYKNAADLIQTIEQWYFLLDFDLPTKYVEGFAWAYNLLPIEHAFVKIGDKYIDPTFERVLHRDVREEIYVSCIELDPETMARYQVETGFYGNLYQYDYLCKNRTELAAKMRALNPHNH